MRILDFSDELLCFIFSFLNGADKLQTSKTCTRFCNLLKDRKLLRINNFSRSVHLPFVDIRNFLLPGLNHVVELNLTSCCNLKSSDILSLARRLPSLKHFYVADTKFQLQHLFLLLNENQQITKVSLTWEQALLSQNHICYSSCAGLANIQSLFIYVMPSGKHTNLRRFIAACTTLQELRIIALACLHVKDYFPAVSKSLKSLAVNSHVCACYSDVEMAAAINSLVESIPDWDYFIFDYRGSDVFAFKPAWLSYFVPNTPLENLDNMKNARAVCFPEDIGTVTKKCVVSNNLRLASANVFDPYNSTSYCEDGYPNLKQIRIFTESQLKLCRHLPLPQLKEVRIARENPKSYCTDLSHVKNWTNLTKLCVSSCILKPSSSTEKFFAVPCYRPNNVDSLPQAKKRRVAHKNSESLLKDLVNSSPDLRELEIRGCLVCLGEASDMQTSALNPVQADGELLHVSLWVNLEMLLLSKVPIRNGAFLVQVAQSCPQLSSLYLSNLGLKGLCSYTANLVKALPYFKNLKDFRLHQKCLGDVTNIFTALKDCSNLERLAIVCASNPNHKLNQETVMDFVQKAEKLRFLFLCFDNDTLGIDEAKSLKKAVKSMQESRPLLIAKIHSYIYNFFSVPINKEEDWTKYILNNFHHFKKIPAFHLVEMVFHRYRASAAPLFWESYDLFH